MRSIQSRILAMYGNSHVETLGILLGSVASFFRTSRHQLAILDKRLELLRHRVLSELSIGRRDEDVHLRALGSDDLHTNWVWAQVHHCSVGFLYGNGGYGPSDLQDGNTTPLNRLLDS